MAGGQILAFFIDIDRRQYNTLALPCECVSMFADASEHCKTCDICQRTKINYGHRCAPLHSIPFPDKILMRLSMDHKRLTRTTVLGNTAILVIICPFALAYKCKKLQFIHTVNGDGSKTAKIIKKAVLTTLT